MSTKTKVNFERVWADALEAGHEAVKNLEVVPMIVGTPTTPLGSDIDYSKKTYFVADGLCGFAWVGFAGNTAFGRWAKAEGIADKAYGGGLHFWIREFGQSVQRKEVFAGTIAGVLRNNGIEAYASSRLD